MNWKNKIEMGMWLLSQGCKENRSTLDCAKCPFDEYCNAIQLGAEAELNVDIPENWDYDCI